MSRQLSEKTIEFLEDAPIFFQPWWLQAVSPDNWGVTVVEKGEEVVAVLPYAYKVRLNRYLLIKMPLLTPYQGPWIKSSSRKLESKRLEEEKQLMIKLIDKLPQFASFDQWFHPFITNWLPFHWKEFQETTLYTYIIDDLTDLDRVFSNFSYSKRKNIKKAKNVVDVYQDLPCKEFYENLTMTLSKQGKRILYSYEFFRRFYNACIEHNAGKIFYAVDRNGNLHAAIFIVYDNKSAYYLISTIDPDFRNSGSVSLLVQEAIKFASTKNIKFDFCGSMIETIERSSREFGGKQVPFFEISKIDSKIVKTYRSLYNLVH